MILFIDNYDSFIYNLVDYIGQLRSDVLVARNDQITVNEIENLKPDGIVISPGPGRPEQAGFSCQIIQTYCHKIPILGVCLGLQAIGQVFGAKIVRAPVPVHGKASSIEHNGQGIFRGMASPITAGRYHSLVIERESLPECFTITAESDDHLIMAIAHQKFPLFGVQFHPESVLTPDGMQILRNWVKIADEFKNKIEEA
ncbi:MAG TPA: aminodeoxychorismate/anthranilate synthase component II [Candidatus Marinimicrobia bacterium]|nr:aminodeoxychorismate/anthranilate synthase component II [Candidatus Neomarinimicrobiota bacterium]HRS50949.1 aminodeoxychorismate/anthranilate synthase component II [Candidatus Neomarinimicrobiota bacterium]HRU91709.1 aminodeoxychorismate/anthranilate synthase component II [Candidatus Neomarinimicrobiota bacterium]